MLYEILTIGYIATLATAQPIDDEADEEYPSNWVVRIERDAFTARVNAAARLTALNGDVLSFACNGHEDSILSVQFLTQRHLGSRNNVVTLKFGEDAPIAPITWEYSSQGAYIVDEPYIEIFSQSASTEVQRILVRALNYEDQPVDAAFISRNARSAINELRLACGSEAL